MKLRLMFIYITCFLFAIGGVMGLTCDERVGVVAAPYTDLVATQVKFTLEEEPVVQAASSLIPELFERPAYRRTQLLFNEPVSILEEKNGWYRVRALEQLVIDDEGSRGCHGWVRSEHVRIDQPVIDLNLVVATLQAPVYASTSKESSVLMNFSCGTKVKGITHNAEWYRVQLLDNSYGFVAACDVSIQEELQHKSIEELRKIIVQQSLQFAHIPYVWGGRNAHGIDCSALIQLGYLACGITIPRYAHGQWKACRPVELNQLKQGDLIFLGTIRDDQFVMVHVILYVGEDMLLEAHGFLGKVRLVSVRERLGKSLEELRNGDAVPLRRFVYGGTFIG